MCSTRLGVSVQQCSSQSFLHKLIAKLCVCVHKCRWRLSSSSAPTPRLKTIRTPSAGCAPIHATLRHARAFSREMWALLGGAFLFNFKLTPEQFLLVLRFNRMHFHQPTRTICQITLFTGERRSDVIALLNEKAAHGPRACFHCKKSAQTIGMDLMRCSRCSVALYCGRASVFPRDVIISFM